MTVPQLFDWIEELLDLNPDFAELQFDGFRGLPLLASFDPIHLAIDDEQSISTRNLKPLVDYTDLQAELDAATQRWDDLGWLDYAYRFNWSCFCIEDYVAPMNIAVARGEVKSVRRVEDNQPVSQEWFNDFVTVEELFVRLQVAIDEGAASINAEFDPTTGLPIQVFIDYDERIADEELGWFASDAMVIK